MRKTNGGYTLITTILVMVVLFVIGVAGAMLVYYGNMTSSAMINYQKAYYNADYGLQEAAYNAMNNLCNCQNNECGTPLTQLSSGGTVQVITQADVDNRTCFIEAIGTGQTGGKVIRAVDISTGTSNWGALGILNGTLNIEGSAAINGCDYIDQCEASGILQGYSVTINGNPSLFTCQNNPNSNNPKGIGGNPIEKQTSASDVTQLITSFTSFSQLQNYILNQLASYLNTQANLLNGTISIPTQNLLCYCSTNATASNSSITCGKIALNNNCQYYYINGTLTVNSTTFGNNQIVYANNIDITGNTLNIQGGLLYTPGTLTINTHGNSTIGCGDPNYCNPIAPTTLIAQNASITMHGTSSINGLLLFSNLSDFSIGNSSVNGALYTNSTNGNAIQLSGNTSINFNYTTLQAITNTFPNLFIPINCYSQGPQQEMFNATTIY